jgi:hypothetical protein
MIYISWKAYIEDEEVEQRLEEAVDIVVDALVKYNLKEILIKDPSGIILTVHRFPDGDDIIVDHLYE